MMVKRIALLSAALVAALTFTAFAVDDTESSIVTVTLPTLFDLSTSGGSINAAFGTLSAGDVADGDSHIYTATSPGHLVVLSNFDATDLKDAVTTNFGAGFVVSLKARTYNPADGTASGYITIMNNGTPTVPQSVVAWGTSGVNSLHLAPVSFQMTNVSVADSAGSYSAVVTHTLSGS